MRQTGLSNSINPIHLALARKSQQLLGTLLLASCLCLSACQQQTTNPDLEAFNGEADQHLREAQRLIRKGDFESAFMHLNKALVIKPNDPGVHRDIGWLYVYTDQLSKATGELQKMEALAPESPEADYLAGAIYDRLEQPADAVKYYQLALKGNEGHPGLKNKPELYFDLAASLNQINSHQEALSQLEYGLTLAEKEPVGRSNAAYFNDGQKTNFYFALCSTHYSLKNFKKALSYCEKAAQLTTDTKEQETITDFMEKLKLLQIMEKT